MSGKKIIAGATEAVAVAKGEQPATAIWQFQSTPCGDPTKIISEPAVSQGARS